MFFDTIMIVSCETKMSTLTPNPSSDKDAEFLLKWATSLYTCIVNNHISIHGHSCTRYAHIVYRHVQYMCVYVQMCHENRTLGLRYSATLVLPGGQNWQYTYILQAKSPDRHWHNNVQTTAHSARVQSCSTPMIKQANCDLRIPSV